MKVLFLVSEAVPYVKVGGLGDVAGVAVEKTKLFKALRPGGTALASMDYPELWDAALAVTPRVRGLSTKGQGKGASALYRAKYLGAEAGFHACERAILTHGGFGYAKEYHVERYLREVMIARIAPVSREQILSYIAERVLGLPKSY